MTGQSTTKGEQRKARKLARAERERDRPLAHVMLDWSGSRNRRRARVARDYWDAYESGRPMGSDDY